MHRLVQSWSRETSEEMVPAPCPAWPGVHLLLPADFFSYGTERTWKSSEQLISGGFLLNETESLTDEGLLYYATTAGGIVHYNYAYMSTGACG